MKLRGKDAERLLGDLKNTCSPEEARKRSASARVELAEMMRPKAEKKNYVVKTRLGEYWTGEKWVCCQVCALRMIREEAHRIAHQSSDRLVVVRITGRK